MSCCSRCWPGTPFVSRAFSARGANSQTRSALRRRPSLLRAVLTTLCAIRTFRHLLFAFAAVIYFFAYGINQSAAGVLHPQFDLVRASSARGSP